MADGGNPRGEGVKSALRTLDILELVVAEGRPLAAQEIASALGIPLSSLTYLLQSLAARGYLVRDGRRYLPGPGLARLRGTGMVPGLAARATAAVRRIAAELEETTGFFVRRGGEAEALASAVADRPLRYTIAAGQKVPLHAVSAGKALLAALDDDALDRWLAETDRRRHTPATLVDGDALRAEIARIRAEGFARSRGEHTLGIVGIARAVTVAGRTVGAFSVAVPEPRFNAALEGRIKALLTAAADDLARQLTPG